MFGSSRAFAIVVVCVTTVVVTGVASAQVSAWAPAQKIDEIGGNNAEVNTPSLDGCPIQSPDGLNLYIASNRPGGKGGLDIWVATRTSTTAPWGAPANLGEPVNSADDFWPTPVGGEERPLLRKPGSAARSMRSGRHLLHAPQWRGSVGRAPAAALRSGRPEQRARRAGAVLRRRESQGSRQEIPVLLAELHHAERCWRDLCEHAAGQLPLRHGDGRHRAERRDRKRHSAERQGRRAGGRVHVESVRDGGRPGPLERDPRTDR